MKKILVILVVAIVLGGCSKKNKETEWDVFQEPIKSQTLPTAVGGGELAKLWGRDIGNAGEKGYATLRPGVDGNSVFVSNRKGTVLRLDAESGKVVWRNKLKQSVFVGVGVGAGLVTVGLDNGTLVALDSETGEKKWQVEIGRQISAVPTLGGNRVVLRTSDGFLMGLGAETGKVVWSVQRRSQGLGLHGDASPLIVDNTVITGLSNGRLLANGLSNGKDFWETDLSFISGSNEIERLADVDAPPVVVGDNLYAATYQGDLVALDLQSSSIAWRYEVSTRLPISVDNKTLFVTDALGGIVALDAQNGELNWSQPAFQGRGVSNPVGLGDYLAIGDARGNIHLLNADDGTLVQSKRFFKGPIVSLVLNKGGLIAFSAKGDIVAVEIKAN